MVLDNGIGKAEVMIEKQKQNLHFHRILGYQYEWLVASLLQYTEVLVKRDSSSE